MASSDNLASIPKLREAMQNTASIDEKNVWVFFKLKNPSKNVFICSIAMLTEEHSSCRFMISKKSSTWLYWFIINVQSGGSGIWLYYLLYEIASTLSRTEEQQHQHREGWWSPGWQLVGCLASGCVVLCFNSITSSITKLSIDGVSCSQPS